jgi:hypothetical protein
LGEFGGVEFVDAVADVFGEDEIEDGLEFGVVGGEGRFGVVGALWAGEGREGGMPDTCCRPDFITVSRQISNVSGHRDHLHLAGRVA